MRRAQRTLFAGFTMLLGAALTGCSGEPTGAEMQQALQSEMDRANELARTMLGEEAGAAVATTIHTLDKLGCTPTELDGRAAYRCRVEMDITYPPDERQRRKASIRMVKEESGWTVVKRF